jgi:hypothetical protein
LLCDGDLSKRETLRSITRNEAERWNYLRAYDRFTTKEAAKKKPKP